MAAVNYTNVRRYIAKRFDVSTSYTGRGGRTNLSEGVAVRSSHIDGVVVDYTAGSTAWAGDGSKRTDKLAEIRAWLEEKYTVTAHWANDGRLIVSAKTEA